MGVFVPEKRPKQSLAAAGPAAGADDTPPPSLMIYSHCGTSAGTHTTARRDGRDLEWTLQQKQENHKEARRVLRYTILTVTYTVVHRRLDQRIYSVQNWTDDVNLQKHVSDSCNRLANHPAGGFFLPDFPPGSPSPAQNPPRTLGATFSCEGST